jgi:hypothetical protein
MRRLESVFFSLTVFTAWRKVLKDLINYFRDLHKSYEVKSKTLMGTTNLMNNTTMPSNFLTSGGIGEATYIMKEFHKQALNEANKARDLENEVIIQLTGLRSDLQQKIKEIKSLSGDFKNSVDKEQEATKKAVRSLQESLGMVDADAATTSGKGDPFLVKLGVDKQVERQIEEENYLHRVSDTVSPRWPCVMQTDSFRPTSIWKHLVASWSLLWWEKSKRHTMCWLAFFAVRPTRRMTSLRNSEMGRSPWRKTTNGMSSQPTTTRWSTLGIQFDKCRILSTQAKTTLQQLKSRVECWSGRANT